MRRAHGYTARMRKGLLICAALAALAVGAAVGLTLWQGATQSRLPVAAVLPQHTAYYVEARDLRGLIKGVRATQAWKDLQESGLLDELDDGALSSFASDVQAISEKIDYPLDEATAMKLLGDEAAVSVWLDGADEAHLTIVTRIDAEALATDLLTGDLDWKALQKEIDARVERADVTVAHEDYGGYVISKATKGERTVWSTLLQDLLVVSDSRDGVATAIDLRVAEGETSLDRMPEFREELARLPDGAPVREWMNLAQLRGRKVRLPKAEEPLDLAPMLGAMSAPAVARAIELPENDLYELSWTWSRSGSELFADGISPDLRATLPPGAIVYLEVQRLGQLVEAWNVSPVKAHLEGSWAKTKIDEAFAEGEQRVRDLAIDEATEQIPELSSNEFVKRFGLHMAGEFAASTLGEQAAFAVWHRPGTQVPGLMCAVRLDTDGRMVELLMRLGMDTDSESEDLVLLPHGDRVIRGFASEGDTDTGFYYAAAGDLALVGNDLDRLREALDRADGKVPGARDTITPATAGLPDDHRFLLVFAPRPYLAFSKEIAGDDPSVRDGVRLWEDLLPYDSLAAAVYVPDDLSQIEMRGAARFDPERADTVFRPWYDVAPGAPRSLDVLPDGAIWTTASRLNIAAGLRAHRQSDYGVLTEALDEMVTEFEQGFEIDVDDALIPSLGDEMAMTVLFEDGSEHHEHGVPPIPGVAIAIAMRDQRPMTQLLDRLSAMAHEAAAEDAASPEFVREERKGATLYRVVQKPASRELPFDPTVAWIGDFLVVALDDSTVDDLLAVRDGTRGSHSASDLATRVRSSGLPVDGNEFQRIDWDLLLDQIAVYAPQLAEAFVDEDDVPMPEFPEDGDMEEWQRRMEAWETARAEAAKTKVADVHGAIDSMRFIDFIASTAGLRGDVLTLHGIVRFKK